jgi:hypothetical protein
MHDKKFCICKIISDYTVSWTFLHLKTRTRRCLEMSGSDYSVTRRHAPEERDPELHSHENHTTRTFLRPKFVL